AVISDIHYAGVEERAQCANFYVRKRIKRPAARIAARLFHRFIWLHEHGGHNQMLDRFLAAVGPVDLVVANGDYSCNVAQVGLSDAAAFASAQECLGKLRARFGEKFRATLGDHDLGKIGLFTGTGSMRLASWRSATEHLGIEPFWRVQFGKYILLGITSSLVALPVFKMDLAAGDAEAWEQLRARHLEQIRAAFAGLKSGERVILFCHDPSALPYLWHEETVREKISQLEQTIIGHLHTNLVLRTGRVLAGFPTISFLGKGARRISTALGQASLWKPFRVRLCPAPMGIQLLKDGGWLSIELDADATNAARFEFHPLKWRRENQEPKSK
ncbi:MAG TPA: metallophosphoesterase, partial [Verrucomicrobiae bacterium]|nr:metallophosphoesterase [Verrucomicrobiae bacterium]